MSSVIKYKGNPKQAAPFSYPAYEDYFRSHPDVTPISSGSGGGVGAQDPNSKIEEMLSLAKKQAESLRTEAFEQGYSEGQHRGKADAAKRLESVLNAIKNVHEEMNQKQAQILKDSEDEIVELALEVARKVIGAELSNDPATVAKVVRSALDRIKASKVMSIRLNPADYEFLRDVAPDFLAEYEVTGDLNVAPGGAVLETDTGNFDAQVEEQLAEIEKSLKQGVVSPDGVEA